MKSWTERPQELAFLFNPAFCGECLLRYLDKYREYGGQGSPYSLLFLVLPVALHKNTRNQINPQIRKPFHRWIQENSPVRAGFAQRARSLVDITREALRFLSSTGAISRVRESRIVPSDSYRRVPSGRFGDDEVAGIYRTSEILGRWYARAGGPVNVWGLWGVRP